MNKIIYKYTSPEGKSYIGKTINEKRRKEQHRYCSGNCTAFHNAIKLYGFINFKYEILHSDVESDEELNRLEIFEIENHNTLTPNGYNMLIGGDIDFREKIPIKQKVLCVETKEVFESVAIASREKEINRPNISRVINGNGKTKMAGGFHWVKV